VCYSRPPQRGGEEEGSGHSTEATGKERKKRFNHPLGRGKKGVEDIFPCSALKGGKREEDCFPGLKLKKKRRGRPAPCSPAEKTKLYFVSSPSKRKKRGKKGMVLKKDPGVGLRKEMVTRTPPLFPILWQREGKRGKEENSLSSSRAGAEPEDKLKRGDREKEGDRATYSSL